MSIKQAVTVPVLIVGAGPVGMLAALLLARQGMRSIIVERRTSMLTAPKAHALNPRSLEICAVLGIPRAEIEIHATPAREGALVRFVTTLNGLEIGSLPYERQDDAVLALTPTPLLNIAQPQLEAILIDRCAQNPLIEIRRGHRWVSAEQNSTVASSVSTEQGESIIHSRYLIAADGAGSSVREYLAIDMEGPRDLDRRVMIHFRADLRNLLSSRPAILYWTMAPAASGTVIAYDIASTFVFMHRYDSALTNVEQFDVERCRALVRAAIGDPLAEIEIEHILPWTMSAQVARSYRQDLIFLTGDAAHRFPPSGGLGLNTGIQDVHNLIWKIAAVEHGHALEGILDSYEQERRPIAVQNSDQSESNAVKIRSLYSTIQQAAETHPSGFAGLLADPKSRDELTRQIDARREHFDSLRLQLGFVYGEEPDNERPIDEFIPDARAGARLPHGWISIGSTEGSSLDLVHPDRFTLIVGCDGDRWAKSELARSKYIAIARDQVDFADPSGRWQGLVGLAPHGAILVRPDGHVLVTAQNDDPRSMDDFEREMAGYLMMTPGADGAANTTRVPNGIESIG